MREYVHTEIDKLMAIVDGGCLDRVATWKSLRKLSYIISFSSMREEDIKYLLQILKKLREMMTPRDVVIAYEVIHMLESIISTFDDETNLIDELRNVCQEYAKLIGGISGGQRAYW